MDQVKPKIIEIVDDRIQPYIDTITQNKDALILQKAELKKTKRRNKIPKIQARQDKPTHFDTRTGNTSLLDPILVTDSIPVVDKDTIPIDRGISDHDGTYVTIDCGFTSSRTYKRTIWDYKNVDFDLMNQMVLGSNWEHLISDADNINVACTNFTKSLLDIASECIPTREVVVRCDDKIWYNSNLRREMRKRYRFCKLFLRLNSASAEFKFKQQRNKVNNLKKQTKKHFYASLNENLDEIKQANPKQYWKIINMHIKNDRPVHDVPPLKDPNQNYNLAYESTEKSEILKKYFCSIANLENPDKDLPVFNDRCVDFLSLIVVSEQDVHDIVSTLDVKKAVGPDIRMLLAVRNQISKPLCVISKVFLTPIALLTCGMNTTVHKEEQTTQES
ncbi:unnamed protein product [Mytilus coruscus]|uniref:Uncharacterized protein n=1 Tax=Mytilus coruscus TaxID=42192 RepID=A0A6J8BKI7_MYTCO|nr:unnamed protein product [Mytilus coruscus]